MGIELVASPLSTLLLADEGQVSERGWVRDCGLSNASIACLLLRVPLLAIAALDQSSLLLSIQGVPLKLAAMTLQRVIIHDFD